jgi:hypothetical protein
MRDEFAGVERTFLSVAISIARLAGLCVSLISAAEAQEKVTLKATPKTVAWGYYDAKAAPVLHVKSGDTVDIETLITSSPSGWKAQASPPSRWNSHCATFTTR